MPPGPLGVAVSGGGDSVALLLLLARRGGLMLEIATIDHGLRPESVAEADTVARLAASRGIPHQILRWDGPHGGNLQAAARDARRDLLAGWAARRGLIAIALGHTLDDQAETVLMRLARGSGVDGLSAMAPVSCVRGLLWVRPLLGLRRAALRAWLETEGTTWIEDPTNTDPALQRTRARAALAAIAPLGLTPERLAATASRMAEARTALEAATAALAREAAVPGEAGEVELDPAPLAAAPHEIALRLLAATLMWVSGARYRPRLEPLSDLLAAATSGGLRGGATLHGCVLRARSGRVAVRREPAAAAPPVPLEAGAWDGRWALVESDPAAPPGLVIGALGSDGLARIPNWRSAARAPRETLLTTPSIRRRDGMLVAAPFVTGGPWRFRRIAATPPPWAPESQWCAPLASP